VTQVSWAIRDSEAVALTGRPDTNLHLEPFDPTELAERVMAFAGVAGDPTGSGHRLDVTVAAGAVRAAVAGIDDPEAETVVAIVGAGPRVVRVRSLARSGGVVRGNEESWLVGPMSSRLVQPGANGSSGIVTLRPAAISQLIALLPAAEPTKEPSA
jgi:hypothetical protein